MKITNTAALLINVIVDPKVASPYSRVGFTMATKTQRRLNALVSIWAGVSQMSLPRLIHTNLIC